MKIGEVIQRVQSLYSKGAQSDSTRLTSKHIYNKILSTRSRLLSQEAKKKQKISDWNFQTIPCIELIEVSASDCPCIPCFGCKVLRTKYELPKPLTNLNGHIISWVLSEDDNIRFDESNRLELRHIMGNKYTSKEPKYLIDNNYGYFYGRNLPKIVKVRLLLEDPIEILTFPSYCGINTSMECMSPLDMEFPMDADLVDTLIEMCVKELIVVFGEATEDLSADSKDSLKEQSK